MSNFERDTANTMLDAADARIASLEADKADLLRVLGVADEKIRSGEDARGQYIRENAALEARCRELEAALAEVGRTCNGEAGCKGYKYANGKLPPTSETHPESGTPRKLEVLRLILGSVTGLTKLRQDECKHLSIENFAPELFRNMLAAYYTDLGVTITAETLVEQPK